MITLNPFERSAKPSGDGGRGKKVRIHTVVEIDAPPSQVFDLWTRFETLPRVLDGVRRVKCISETRTLWDVDIAGRQIVWEAETTAFEPNERIAWESRWGKCNDGELRFHRTIDGRTRLSVSIQFEANTLFERLAARFGLVGQQVESDLSLFRRHVESTTERSRHDAHGPGRMAS